MAQDLIVSLKADNKDLKKGLVESQKEIQRLRGEIEKAKSGIGGFQSKIGGLKNSFNDFKSGGLSGAISGLKSLTAGLSGAGVAFAGAAGIIAGAGAAMYKYATETNAGEDAIVKLNSVIPALQDNLGGLITGNASFFQVANAAIKAAEAADQLGTSLLELQVVTASQDVAVSELTAQYEDYVLTAQEAKKAGDSALQMENVAKARVVLQEIQKNFDIIANKSISTANDQAAQLIAQFELLSGVSAKNVGGFKGIIDLMQNMNKYQAEYNKMDETKINSLVDQGKMNAVYANKLIASNKIIGDEHTALTKIYVDWERTNKTISTNERSLNSLERRLLRISSIGNTAGNSVSKTSTKAVAAITFDDSDYESSINSANSPFIVANAQLEAEIEKRKELMKDYYTAGSEAATGIAESIGINPAAANDQAQAFSTLSGALGDVANAASGINDNPGIRALASSLAILSAVEGVAKATTWYEKVAAIAAMTAATVSMFSSLNNQKFANGGIVGGSSYSGDRIMANVNSGEMILNHSQQSNLFKMINEGDLSSSKNVEFKISGTELIGVISNSNKKYR